VVVPPCPLDLVVKDPVPDKTQEREWEMVMSGGNPKRAPAGVVMTAQLDIGLPNNQYAALTDTDGSFVLGS
jgi:hypothetical protein